MNCIRRSLAIAALLACVAPSAAMAQRSTPPGKAASLVSGTWSGTASVPLGDSTIVVPVTYNFVEAATGVGGTAFVPGQGIGQISNVVRTGKKLQFLVTVPAKDAGKPPSLLEHELEFSADGATLEGMVNLDKKPVAKVKITPQKK
ncbi:MAG TPA: hypothetical protein VE967_10350 [Gemmatimonadaceae bacterium]|nr:hypothetical protein [Gemmatimonadaceae bacterium]